MLFLNNSKHEFDANVNQQPRLTLDKQLKHVWQSIADNCLVLRSQLHSISPNVLSEPQRNDETPTINSHRLSETALNPLIFINSCSCWCFLTYVFLLLLICQIRIVSSYLNWGIQNCNIIFHSFLFTNIIRKYIIRLMWLYMAEKYTWINFIMRCFACIIWWKNSFF